MRSAKLLVCSLAILPAAGAHALGDEENLFNFKVSADYGRSDNATRESVEELKIKENQGIYTAIAGAHYSNEWSNLLTNYRLEKETFERDSQPDRTELEGHTQLILGNEFDTFGLVVSHDRRAMLDTPDAIDLTSNRDTREIFGVSPSAKMRLSTADALMLMGTYANISYSDDEQRKSEQKGAQLAWMHGISKTDQLQVAAQQLETSFEHAPQADYKLQVVSAEYRVALKRLEYSVRVGYNKAIPQSPGEDFDSPSYLVESSFDSGINRVSLSLSQTITDSSSMGGASSMDGFNPGAGVSSKGVGLDLINLRNIALSWSTTAICERCSFGVNASQMKQDYQSLKEDGEEYSVGANFGYRFTRESAIKLTAQHRERKFSATGSRTGFDSDYAKISFEHDLSKGFQLELYVQQEKRSSKAEWQNYRENIAGLKISYDLK
jgi:hypothetical protein